MISALSNIALSGTSPALSTYSVKSPNRGQQTTSLPGMNLAEWNRMVQELQERVEARIDIFFSQSTVAANRDEPAETDLQPTPAPDQNPPDKAAEPLHVNLVA